jgi:hypothetical protein
MRGRLFRLGTTAVLIGFGLLSTGWGLRTYSKGSNSHSQEIEVHYFHWGTTGSQLLRVCVGAGSPSQASDLPTESVSLNFSQIKIEYGGGAAPLERELSFRVGEFRCMDFSYAELVAAAGRLGTDPATGATLPYLIVVTTRSPRDRTETIDSNETITIHGATENVDVATGKIELYQPFSSSR